MPDLRSRPSSRSRADLDEGRHKKRNLFRAMASAAKLAQELGQAQAGTHPRQKAEEKRLIVLKGARIKEAEQKRQLRIDAINSHYEAEAAAVKISAPCEMLPPASRPRASQRPAPR